MDKLDFLSGEEPQGEAVVEAPVAEAPVAEAPAETAPEAEAPIEKPAQPRASDGKFAKKEAEAKPEVPEGYVPVQALQELRKELQALKNPPTEQPKAPDIFEDPDGYQAFQQSQLQQALLNTTLNISEEVTRQSVGAELVDAAQQWAQQQFQQTPALYQQFISQRNPYGFLVQQYQGDQTLSKLNADPKQVEAFLAWQQAQQQLQQQPAQAAPQPSAPPPVSIASAPSAGGVQQIATGPGVAFAEFIK